MSMDLAWAERVAAKIAAELAGYCERIEIAGSIRRKRPVVNDIDLVVLPKPNLLGAVKERCRRNARVITDGDTNYIVELYGLANQQQEHVQLDIFIAQPAYRDLLTSRPTNFGTLWLNRTGSVAHNIYLVQRAKGLGLRWNPYYGVFGRDPQTGQGDVCLACETEEAVFGALGLEFVPPEKRER